MATDTQAQQLQAFIPITLAGSAFIIFLARRLGVLDDLVTLKDRAVTSTGAVRSLAQRELGLFMARLVQNPQAEEEAKAQQVNLDQIRAELSRVTQGLNAEFVAITSAPRPGPFPDLPALETEDSRLLAAVDAAFMPGQVYLDWHTTVFLPERQRLAPELPPVVAPPVSLPPVTVPPGALVIPGAGVAGGVPLDAGALATGISAGLAGSLPAALSQALSGALSQFSRNHHVARAQCQTTSALEIARSIGVAALPLVLPVTALRTDVGLSLLDKVGVPFFEELILPKAMPSPATPENVPQAATRLVLQRAAFGAAAHLWAQTVESFSALKHMGMGQFAAFFADLAGFERLATALMSPVEFAAVTNPMRRYANKLYRSTIPDPNTAAFYYAKKELQPSEFISIMQEQGFSDSFIRVSTDAAFLDPRLAEIVRIGQFFQPAIIPELRKPTADVVDWWSRRGEWTPRMGGKDKVLGPDWWFIYKLAKGGYEPTDVLVLTEVAKRATARREQTLFLDATTRLYRDGFIGDERLQGLVDEAWDLSDPISARIRATQLRAEFEDLSDFSQVVLRSMSRGLLTSTEAEQALLGAGMRPEKITLEILKERLGLLPRQSLELEGQDTLDLAEEVAVAGAPAV